jgi:hypothetical protein
MIPHLKVFSDYPSLNSIVAKLYIVLIYNLPIFIANFLILANVFLLGWVWHATAWARSLGRSVGYRGCIFSHVRPFYKRVLSNPDP